LPPTPDVITRNTDIGKSMTVVGRKPVVIEGAC
jgi:hypothetical protein